MNRDQSKFRGELGDYNGKKSDRKDFAERWITIGEDKGVHLKIDDKGIVKTGPKDMKGKSVKEAGKQLYESKTAKQAEKKVEAKKEEAFDKKKFKEQGTKLIDEMLTEEEELSVSDYSGSTYQEINQTLRGDWNFTSEEHFQHIKKEIAKIDSAIEKGSQLFKEPIVVYRGASAKRFNIEQFKPGHEIELPAFQSTTLDKSQTEEFEKGIMFNIKTSEGLFLNGAALYKEEEEVLLPRGRLYKINGVKGNVVDIELLPKEK